MRTGVLEEYQAAVKTTISKRRQIERLKASSNIRPDRVDEALEDMEEVSVAFPSIKSLSKCIIQANKYEQVLAKRAEGISQNLHQALQTHNRYANDDITTALIEHARSSIMYERQLLRELEALRVDVSNAAKKVIPAANSAPKPTIIPPLEEFNENRLAVSRPNPPGPAANGFQRGPAYQQNPPQASPIPGPLSQRPPFQNYPSQGPNSQEQAAQGPLSSGAVQPSPQRREPLSGVATQTFSSYRGPSSPAPTHTSFRPPQSPGAGPSSPTPSQITFARPPLDEPPLGGRFVDGSRSMFIKPTQRTQSPPLPVSSSSTFGQRSHTESSLYSDPLSRPAASPLHEASAQYQNGRAPQDNSFDPLGHIKPHQMSSSVRVQPTRPRLDAREAASKLANMF